jgi:hypothetical protein
VQENKEVIIYIGKGIGVRVRSNIPSVCLVGEKKPNASGL